MLYSKCMNHGYFIYAAVLLFFAFFTVGSYASAGTTGLSIQPVKVSHTIEPGESVSAINVDVVVEDFVPSAGTTNIDFVGRAEGLTTVRDWISLEIPDDFVFEKGGSRSITYTIQAPPDAEPGGHFGVAFFKATEITDAGTLKVGTRIGMLIFVTVPGNQLQKGNILDFDSPFFVQRGPIEFKIKFENTGTVHFEPKGAITITNIFGKAVGEIPVSGQVVLPTGVRDLNVQWNVSGFLLGRYTAALALVDGEGNELTAENISFYAFPIWYTVGFFGALIVVFFFLRFLKRRVRISIKH